jgi:hypothetical protein
MVLLPHIPDLAPNKLYLFLALKEQFIMQFQSGCDVKVSVQNFSGNDGPIFYLASIEKLAPD